MEPAGTRRIEKWLHNAYPPAKTQGPRPDLARPLSSDGREPVDENSDVGATPRRPRRRQDATPSASTSSASSIPFPVAAPSAATPSFFSALDVSKNIHRCPSAGTPSSSAKRAKTTASLSSLQRPVQFRKVKEQDIAEALPLDAQRLYAELTAVANKVGILPPSLRGSEHFNKVRTLPLMWADEDAGAQNDDELFSRISSLVNDSVESANMHRSEIAWNTIVHYPALRLLLSDFPSIDVELVQSAQVAKAFRPCSRQGPGDDASSISSLTSGGGARVSTSVHKMVDLALVLRPDEQMEAIIDDFLESEAPACATVNQTTYEPLCRRPAPVFIKTKTSSGNIEAANLQLGICVTAYHERLKSILEQHPASAGGNRKRLITLPVVQWYDGTCIVSFAVDAGSGIDVLDVDLRAGGTNTIVGAYQLRKTVTCLAAWLEQQFKPWFMSILTPELEPA